MCGNGIRCVAEWLHVHEPTCAAKPVLKIDTRSVFWQVEMGAGGDGGLFHPRRRPARREHGRRAAGPLPADGGRQDLGGHLHQRGQPPLRHPCAGGGRPQAGGHRPGVRVPPELPRADQHRVRRVRGPHPPEDAGVGARQRRDLGLRHRHLRHGGRSGGAGPVPRGRGRPCGAARRRADHPGPARPPPFTKL